jgi:tRNA pseudouridine13 synthase
VFSFLGLATDVLTPCSSAFDSGVQVEDPATLDLAMESIKTKGFINYYGMQRFGTSHIPTHAVGLAILQQDWALAVDLLLRPRPGEHADAEQGRQHWKNLGDADAALAAMPRRCVAERSLLEFFKAEGKKPAAERDNHGALLTVRLCPANTPKRRC